MLLLAVVGADLSSVFECTSRFVFAQSDHSNIVFLQMILDEILVRNFL